MSSCSRISLTISLFVSWSLRAYTYGLSQSLSAGHRDHGLCQFPAHAASSRFCRRVGSRPPNTLKLWKRPTSSHSACTMQPEHMRAACSRVHLRTGTDTKFRRRRCSGRLDHRHRRRHRRRGWLRLVGLALLFRNGMRCRLGLLLAVLVELVSPLRRTPPTKPDSSTIAGCSGYGTEHFVRTGDGFLTSIKGYLSTGQITSEATRCAILLKVQVCAQVNLTRPQKGKRPQHTLDSDNLCTCTRNHGAGDFHAQT